MSSRKRLEEESLSEDDGIFGENGEEEVIDENGSDESGSESEQQSSEESEAQETGDEGTAKEKPRRKMKAKKNAKRAKKNFFVDTEAGVDDDELDYAGANEDEDLDGYDEEEEEEEEDGFVDNEIEEREKEFNAAFQKRLAAHAARREAAQRTFDDDMSPEAVEARLKQLYGRQRFVDEIGDRAATEATIATMLQPQSSDPKLWLVKCRPGRERAAVANFLHALSLLSENTGVYSVIGKDTLKGFIYVEAHKANDVMTAVKKARMNHTIFASPINRPILVPMAEMADVVMVGAISAGSKTSTTDITSLQPGSWVRVKRGKYNGDLAQVIEVSEEHTGDGTDYIVRVKLLPRLTFRSGGGATRGDRPTPRPFDPQEASQYGSVTKARGYWIYNGDAYKDGLLFKDVRASSLFLSDVFPRPDELERFGSLAIQDSDSGAFGGDNASVIKLTKGEAVIVLRGEFQHMKGIVDSPPEGDRIKVKLEDSGGAFPEPVPIPTKYLIRHLEIGDAVRVVAGEHAGKSGMFVSLEQEGGKKIAYVFSSSDALQVAVPFAYLTSSTAETAPLLPLNSRAVAKIEADALEINDLVTMDDGDSEAGVVIRIFMEERMISLLDVSGRTLKVPWKGLKKVPKPSYLGAARSDPSVFKNGDRVQYTEVTGEIRPATILHIFKNNAFLRTVDRGEVLVKPVHQISRPAAFQASARASAPPTPRSGPIPYHMIGKSVTIIGAGPYKGYVGIVKDINEGTARVELHTDSKVVTVSRDRIMGPATESSSARPVYQPSAGRVTAWGVSEGKESAWGNNSKTPAWGGQSTKTPAWSGQSGKTPAWSGSSAAKTPAWGGSSSAKTPAWGGSSTKTPAWGAAAGKTPAWGGSSGKTPAWGGQAVKTPAWSAPTSSARSVASHSTPSWVIPEAEVLIKSSNSTSRILAVTPSGFAQLSDRQDPVPVSELAPVQPAKKDTVRLLNDDRAIGTVIGLDGPDAVIRVEGTADFRIVPISSLVKIVR